MRSCCLPEVPIDDAWVHLDLPNPLDRPGREEAHVWATRVNWHSLSSLEAYRSVLSCEELARASKFFSSKDREEYLVAHATLRIILARYTGREARDILLAKSEYGKPICLQHPDLSFNLTHGQGVVLIAIAAGFEIGADVEQIRPMPDASEIVRHYFSPREISRFDATERPEQERAFFRLWTRKEAYLKALGLGLSERLDAFEVTFGAGEPFRLSRAKTGPWSLFHLEPFPGFVGALAVRGCIVRLAGGIIGPIAWTA